VKEPLSKSPPEKDQMFKESRNGQSGRDSDCTHMANTSLVAPDVEIADKTSSCSSTTKKMACYISGDPMKQEEFQNQLVTSLWPPGDLVPKNNIKFISRNGLTFVLKGKLIIIDQL